MRPHNGGYLRKRVEKNDISGQSRERKLPLEKELKKFSKFRFLVLNTCAYVSKKAADFTPEGFTDSGQTPVSISRFYTLNTIQGNPQTRKNNGRNFT